MNARVVASALLVGAVLAAGGGARADEPPVKPPPAPRVEWRPEWPRFRPWEYGASAALGLGSLYLRAYTSRAPSSTYWQGRNVVDDTLRGWFRLDSRAGRERASVVSDWLVGSGVVLTFAVDLPVALFAHHEPGVAWQLLLMDLEVNAFAGFVNNLLFYTVGRGRPGLDDCRTNPNYDVLCGMAENNVSFPSGHTLTIATAAGLTCVHHRYLPLYGSVAADRGACALALGLTVATAVARLMSDRHFASDTLIGGAIGFGSGYGLPWLLHYGAGLAPEPDARHVAVVPWAGPRAAGLGVMGAL
jgi:membrane-associated phospholipid phosphatase